IGINAYVAVLDSEGIIRSRCSILTTHPKSDSELCQGHKTGMMDTVKRLLKNLPKASKKTHDPEPGPGRDKMDVAGGWSEAVRISKGGFNEWPSVAVDRRGTLVAAWSREKGGKSSLCWSTLRKGKWTPPVPLPGLAKADAFDIQLERDAKGYIHAVYVSNAEGPYDIWHAAFIGGRWKRAENITKGKARESSTGAPTSSMAPRLCALKDGRLITVWYTWGEGRAGARSPIEKEEWPWKDPAPPRIRDRDLYASILEKGRFSPPKLVSDRDYNGAQDHTDPAIAPHPDGGAYVAWSCDHPEAFMDAFRGQRIFGHTLGRRIGLKKKEPIEPLSPVGSTRKRYPEINADLACDDTGTLWAVWDTTSSRSRPSHRIVLTQWEDDRWKEPRTVAEGETVIAPRIFPVGKDALVLWEEFTKEGVRLWSARASGGPPETLGPARQAFVASGKAKVWLIFAAGREEFWEVYVCSKGKK
ncbi:MAG: hypothetical protein ACYTHM_02550, partial [Planctomycetota bacterium]